jgi:DNA polymerase (family X)
MAAIPTEQKPIFAPQNALRFCPSEKLIDQNRLREIPGVGEAIAGVITEIVRTGTHPSLEKMRADVPASVLEMLNLPGLRSELHKELGINSLAELEAATQQDRLRGVKGFGLALQRKILAGIEAKQDLQSPNIFTGQRNC